MTYTPLNSPLSHQTPPTKQGIKEQTEKHAKKHERAIQDLRD